MPKSIKAKKVKYRLNSKGEFIIENYNFSKPFANFFPGIAGKYGIPMWAFYVNRGQAIISAGIKDKDHSILEFYPANKAWQLAPLLGFRTFIKQPNGKKEAIYEPFHNGFTNLGFELANQMCITSYDLRLKENNLTLGLEVEVGFFTIPNESYAALARIVTIRNLSPRPKKIQLLDGLPQIIPYGTSNLFLKKLGRTIEAWMDVKNLEKGVPFYKLDVDPADRPEVIHINEGNFYLGFYADNKGKTQIIKPIVDPEAIFGPVTDFSYPYEFLTARKFSYPKLQLTKCKTPCGFALLDFKLHKGRDITFYSVIGHMRSLDLLNSLIPKISRPGYLEERWQENKRIIEELQRDINTESSSMEFNFYAKQTYLDNILRGGYPATFGSDSKRSVFYLYSRKHGDLERDYNKFQLQPAYFSQGNGNYRDINQNRRSDVWFNPDIQDENIITFLNLIQADGFNPLVVKGASFTLKNPADFKNILRGLAQDNASASIMAFLDKPFTPGEVILLIEEKKIKLKVPYEEFLNILIANSLKNHEAEHGEGFWTDHWSYNLDLLESYLGVYPEKLKEIVFDKKVFTFYDNTEIVRPRAEKYVLKDGGVKQLHSVARDNSKREMIKKRASQPHTARVNYGEGEIYQTTLLNKLLCLLVNKLASLDPFGVGIEMEADKPNWFDALNGLPALFGSSLCETFELKRLVIFTLEALDKTKVEKISVTEEVYNFLCGLDNLLKQYLNSASPDKDYQYWDKSYALKEGYRSHTLLGFSGREIETRAEELITILNCALQKIQLGINKAWDKKQKTYYSYFINEVVEFETLNGAFVRPKKFAQKKLPLFLEGPMHALRIAQSGDEAKVLYEGVKASGLFDKKLKMYKETASLKEMPEEIGRCRVFTPGWLENESVWLHMEYKYLLETLRQGLYKEFYADFKNTLIPFQDPGIYGRNILENSSFLVSSAFPDKKLWGNGFVARLSGSTAEFLQIWITMNAGVKPFFLNEDDELNLRFKPALAGWLFNKDGTYSFNFLSGVYVVYHNPKRKDTFGEKGCRPQRTAFKDKGGKAVQIPSDTIPCPYAGQVRSRAIKQIDIYFK